ncbi:P-loop containing nucleoside triphosphate hydrolase [Serratia phage vB_SmaS-Totoro]|nr:P-loop containing nucleoside triphosphate hydrolase [Serratia phage vB_SmaS-Totoro]
MKYRIDTNIHNPAKPISITVDLSDKDWYKKAFDHLVEKYGLQDVDVSNVIHPILTMCEDGNVCTGHIAIAPGVFNMAYTITRLLSEEGWDSLNKAIEAEPAPTNELKELMMRPRRYKREQSKELTITITGPVRSGKTSAALILSRLLKCAGIATTVQSDDIVDWNGRMDIMALVEQLKSTGANVVIKESPSVSESLRAVYTIPELVKMVHDLTGGGIMLIEVANNGALDSADYDSIPPETIKALIDLSLIYYIDNSKMGSIGLTNLGQSVFDNITSLNTEEEDADIATVDGPLYSTARLAFYRIRDDENLKYAFHGYDSLGEEDPDHEESLHVAELINIGVLAVVNGAHRLTPMGRLVENFFNETDFTD